MAFPIGSSSKRRCARDSAEGNALHSAGCDHRGLPASGNPVTGRVIGAAVRPSTQRPPALAVVAAGSNSHALLEGRPLGCVRVARSLRKDIRAAGDRDRCAAMALRQTTRCRLLWGHSGQRPTEQDCLCRKAIDDTWVNSLLTRWRCAVHNKSLVQGAAARLAPGRSPRRRPVRFAVRGLQPGGHRGLFLQRDCFFAVAPT